MNQTKLQIKISGLVAKLKKWCEKDVALSILSAVFLFVVSLVVNYLAGTYATSHASNSVRDIILDNIPTLDVDGIFVYGVVVFFAAVVFLLLWRPHNAPFVIKTLSLFIVVRSFFICLTHIGPLPQAIVIPPDSIARFFTFTGDLFFSAHTGMPFLLMLIYWKNIYLRIIFFAFSIVLGTTTLFGHLHYSIDVFAAFFITYSIYKIATKLFKNDFGYLKI